MYLIDYVEFRRKPGEEWHVNVYGTEGYRNTKMKATEHIGNLIEQYKHEEYFHFDIKNDKYRVWFRKNNQDVMIVYKIVEFDSKF